MRANTTGRRRALDVLFEAEIKDILVPGLLRELLAERQNMSTAQVPIRGAGVELVEQVADHLYELDSLIDHYSTWGLRRLSRLDRSVLRLGIAELRYRGVDVPIVVSEYSGIVREIGSSRSVPFITAIFNRVAEDMKEGTEPVFDEAEPAMDVAAATRIAEEAAEEAKEAEAAEDQSAKELPEAAAEPATEPEDTNEAAEAAETIAAVEADEDNQAEAVQPSAAEGDEPQPVEPPHEAEGEQPEESEDRGESHAPQSLADIAGRNQAARAATTGENVDEDEPSSEPKHP